MDDILYKKSGGVLKPKYPCASCNQVWPDYKSWHDHNCRPKVESEKVYGPSQEYLDFINAPKEKFDNVIEVDFKTKRKLV